MNKWLGGIAIGLSFPHLFFWVGDKHTSLGSIPAQVWIAFSVAAILALVAIAWRPLK